MSSLRHERFQLGLMGFAAAVILGAALVQVQAIRNLPVLLLDEARDLPILAEAETGIDAQYTRCKAVLLALGGVLASVPPYEDPTRAEAALPAWTHNETLMPRLQGYRHKLSAALPDEPRRVLMRTDPKQHIQIFRTHESGFTANVTFTVVRESDHREWFTCHFEVRLDRADVTLANPMGFALTYVKPLDHFNFWEETP